MPRYFFDTTDGDTDRDREGSELPDLAAAEKDAIQYIASMAAEMAPKTEPLCCVVRDEAGKALLQVRLTLAVTDIDADGKEYPRKHK